MSNQITQPPNQYDFGHEFNYAVWPKSTEVMLCNVQWTNDYRDVVDFTSEHNIDDYLESTAATPRITVKNVSYVKRGQPVRLNVEFNRAMKFNYMRVSNPLQPVTPGEPKVYYYFVQDVRYVAPHATEFIIQLDVWATYRHHVDFRRAHIERGHIGIANENAFNDFGRAYLSVPEPFDLGAESVVVYERDEPIMSRRSEYPTNRRYGIWWMVITSVDLTDDPGDIDDPNLKTSSGSLINDIPSGTNTYFIQSKTLQPLFSYLRAYPWYAQGVVRIQAVPDPRRYGAQLEEVELFMQKDTWEPQAGVGIPTEDFYIGTLKTSGIANYNVLPGWRNNAATTPHIPQRYRHLRKFWTSPYLWCELSSMSGPKLTLRPENWRHADGRVAEAMAYNPMSPRAVVVPHSYNDTSFTTTTNTSDMGYIGGDGLDRALVMSNMPTTTVVNDQATIALASNAHSLAANRNVLGWQQDRALSASARDVQNADSAITATQESNLWNQHGLLNQVDINQRAMEASRITSAIQSGVQAIPTNPSQATGLVGNMAGLVGSSQQNLIQQQQMTETLNQQGYTAALNTGTQMDMQVAVRDTNKTYAEYAAKGDYSAAIASLDGKIQDMEVTPPSVSGNFAGDTFNLEHMYFGYRAQIRAIPADAVNRVGDYWLRYGYAINRFIDMKNKLSVMEKFTYWKVKELYIINEGVPEFVRQTLRGIFEKGVTVWRRPEYVGKTELHDNQPLNGVRY